MKNVAERALERITKVVRSLQQFAHGRVQVPWDDHDLDQLVQREAKLITTADEKNVVIDLSLHSDAIVRGPEEELRQMILNLIENAVQAVSEGGRVSVQTSDLAGRASLVVKDDGCGIPADKKDHVFDLFFTTKDPGQGMGLGLALCKRTVTDMDGTIEIFSTEGEGTEVVVTLPSVKISTPSLSQQGSSDGMVQQLGTQSGEPHDTNHPAG
jgi:signal transduction histidine kinase